MYIEKNNNGISVSTPEKSWRMVHNDSKVLYLAESTGYINTINKLFVTATKEECLTEAARLGLEIPEKDKN